jgi:hypothetical protein
MTSFALSQIRNFRSCNAGVPRDLEIEAVIEEITEGWDLAAVQATAAQGVADADREAIRELIQAEDLSLSPEDAEKALLGWCRERAEEAAAEAAAEERGEA